MDFWDWSIIAFCFLLYVTYLFIKSLKNKKPLWKSVKDWFVNIIDILSGGG